MFTKSPLFVAGQRDVIIIHKMFKIPLVMRPCRALGPPGPAGWLMWGEVLNITTTLWPAARTTIRHAAHYLISTNYKDQTRFSLSEGVMSRGQGRGVGPLRQDCWYSVKTPWDNFQPRQPQLAVGSHLTPHTSQRAGQSGDLLHLWGLCCRQIIIISVFVCSLLSDPGRL